MCMEIPLGKHLFLSSLILSNTVLFSLSVRDIAVLHTGYSPSPYFYLAPDIKKKGKFKTKQNNNPQETEEVLCCHSCIENLENMTKGNWMLPFIW